ncbi:MAG: 3'-5' exonuclease domain-containing protein 2 [Bacteriovoracaceae bacterium]|nr:3'-5' exonuclease domain-containing protein 2 [Bacteriovoracaceae bacterium]
MNDKLDSAPNFKRARFEGEILTVSKDEEIATALSRLLGKPIIGFDTETKPSFKKGEFYHVSLLQLASDDCAILFRLHHLKDFTLIKSMFEDESIIKAGVAIRDDIKGLQKIFDFAPKSFIELSDMARDKKLKNFGLKGMTEEVLNLTLSKRAKLSNWEASDLKLDQLHYAATDAWIGRELYLALIKS